MTITNERWRYDMRVAIITANTDIYKGTKANESGEAVKLVAEEAGLEVVFMRALPLDREVLSTVMKRMTDGKTADLILTTGGAGCNPGDCTPEATMNIVDRPVPGIPEAMRAHTMKLTRRSMLNRSEEPAIILFIYVGLFVMDKSVYLFLKSETALQPHGAVGGVVYPVVDDSRLHFHAEVGGDVKVGQFGIHIGIDNGQQVYSDEGEDT